MKHSALTRYALIGGIVSAAGALCSWFRVCVDYSEGSDASAVLYLALAIWNTAVAILFFKDAFVSAERDRHKLDSHWAAFEQKCLEVVELKKEIERRQAGDAGPGPNFDALVLDMTLTQMDDNSPIQTPSQLYLKLDEAVARFGASVLGYQGNPDHKAADGWLERCGWEELAEIATLCHVGIRLMPERFGRKSEKKQGSKT